MNRPSAPDHDRLEHDQLEHDRLDQDVPAATPLHFDDELSEETISQVMNLERLADLLAQADAFGVVNAEDLDSF